MAVTPVGSLVVDDNSGAAASVDVPTGAGTDLEVAFGGSDFYAISSGFGPPSGTGWTLRQTVDLGTNNSKIRIWTRTAPAGGHTVTLAPIQDEEVWLAIRRLAGADLAAPVIDVDGATSANQNHTAPALTLGALVGYVLGCAMTEVFEGGGNYTPPSGFTELVDGDVASNAASFTVGEDQDATGTVGPSTWVYSGTGDAGLAAVIAIRAAAAGTTHDAAVTLAATGGTSAAGTRDLAAAATTAATAGAGGAGARDLAGTSTAAGTGQATVAASRARDVAVAAGATGALDATGSRQRDVAITAVATAALTTAGTRGLAGATVLAGTGGLTAVGEGGGDASAEAVAVAGLAATATAVRSGAAEMAGTGALAGAAVRTAVTTAGLATAAGTGMAAAVELAGSAQLDGAGEVTAITSPDVGTTTLVAPVLASSTLVRPLHPSVTAVPPRVPTSGGVA